MSVEEEGWKDWKKQEAHIRELETKVADLERLRAEKQIIHARTVDDLHARIAELEKERDAARQAFAAIRPGSHSENAWFAVCDRLIAQEAEVKRLRDWLEHINQNADGLVDNMSDDALEGLPAPTLENTP